MTHNLIQYGESLNRLLQAMLAVLNDLQSPHLFAGCKAFGIIDKVVTGPFCKHVPF